MHRAAFNCGGSCVGVFFSPLSLQKFGHVINLLLFWCTGRSLPTWEKFNLITWLCYGVLPSVIYCFWPAAEQRSTSKSKALFEPFCSLLSQVPGSDSTPISFWPYMNRIFNAAQFGRLCKGKKRGTFFFLRGEMKASTSDSFSVGQYSQMAALESDHSILCTKHTGMFILYFQNVSIHTTQLLIFKYAWTNCLRLSTHCVRWWLKVNILIILAIYIRCG